MLLNAFRSLRVEKVDKLAAAGVCFDIATLENVGGVGNLVQQITADRVLFGTYAPFFYPESAILKLQESQLGGLGRQAIAQDNARKLLVRSS